VEFGQVIQGLSALLAGQAITPEVAAEIALRLPEFGLDNPQEVLDKLYPPEEEAPAQATPAPVEKRMEEGLSILRDVWAEIRESADAELKAQGARIGQETVGDMAEWVEAQHPREYDPSQPRDEGGRWTSGGGGGNGGGGGKMVTQKGVVDEGYFPPPTAKKLVTKLDQEGRGDLYKVAQDMGLEYDLQAYDKIVSKWTHGADQEAKPEIYEALSSNAELRTLTLYNEWNNSSSQDSFLTWLDKPQTLYRVGGRSPYFMSFSSRLASAQSESKEVRIWTVDLSPRQWLGSGLTGKGEVFIPEEAIVSIGEAERAQGGRIGQETVEDMAGGDGRNA